MPRMPRVEFHGYVPSGAKAGHYSGSDLDGPIDVTDAVVSVQWMHSIHAPWETIKVELALPRRMWSDVLPGPKGADGKRTPATGFWVVLRDQDNLAQPAFAWGRCEDLESGFETVEATGANVTTTVTVTCRSWLSLLQSSRLLITAADLEVQDKGFMYQLQTWGPHFQALWSLPLATKQPGAVLDKLWRNDGKGRGIVHVCAPTSLVADKGGKPLTLGDEIPVVFNKFLARQWAPQRAPQHAPVFGYSRNAFGSQWPRATLWEWFSSTFIADPNLVELFPSLEYPGEPDEPAKARATVATGDIRSIAGEDSTSPVKAWKKGTETNTAADDALGGEIVRATAPQRVSALGRALGGAQPVLIYRIKPYQLLPITQQEARKGEDEGEPGVRKLSPGVPAAERIGAFQKPVSSIPAFGADWYTFPADEVRHLRIRWSESGRVNGVYVRQPLQAQLPSQMEPYGVFGTPVVEHRALVRDGLRLYEADWPFDPAVVEDGVGDVEASFASSQEALIELAYMLTANDGRFASGRFNSLYKPWIKAGHWCRVFASEPSRVTDDITDGFDAYVETVTHTVTVGPAKGEVQARTEIEFARGSAANFVPMPVRGHGFKVRPPRVQAAGVEEVKIGEATGVAEELTEHFKWSEFDPHKDTEVPRDHKLYDRQQRIRGNIRRTATALEVVRAAAIAAVSDAAGAGSPVGVKIVITPNGGYHGPWQDAHWSGHRGAGSQHRQGTAVDFHILFADGTKWTKENVVKLLKLLIQNKKIPGGFIKTYTNETFVHYDIRGEVKVLADDKTSEDKNEKGD